MRQLVNVIISNKENLVKYQKVSKYYVHDISNQVAVWLVIQDHLTLNLDT